MAQISLTANAYTCVTTRLNRVAAAAFQRTAQSSMGTLWVQCTGSEEFFGAFAFLNLLGDEPPGSRTQNRLIKSLVRAVHEGPLPSISNLDVPRFVRFRPPRTVVNRRICSKFCSKFSPGSEVIQLVERIIRY